jgi:hypothetical protein
MIICPRLRRGLPEKAAKGQGAKRSLPLCCRMVMAVHDQGDERRTLMVFFSETLLSYTC